MKEKIVIIGNGIAGITCARYIRKYSNHDILVISAESPYFFSRTALMYVYMGHMKFEHLQPYESWFWEKNRIGLKQDLVTEIDANNAELVLQSGERVKYDKLVLATGSKPNKFGWKGQDLKGVQGLYSKQDLESLEELTQKGIKDAVIVGGGLIGIELAEMLRYRDINVNFLVREHHFWGNVLDSRESEMIMRHMKEHHINLRSKTELKEVVADENGYAKSIITTEGEEIPCQFVGLTAGVSPNIEFVRSSSITTNRGIVVDSFLQTNIENVYAIGDCAEFVSPPGENRRNIEQVWYTGKEMGKVLAKTICGTPTKYSPGHWFNSAKFLDIEYQTYGWIFPQPKENEQHFYWEHTSGKKSVRINYDKSTRAFIGINTFGIRMRHQAFEKWLNEKRSVEYVLEHLADANFDPEFYKKHEKEIVAKFNSENNTQLKVQRFNWKNIF